MSSTRRAGGVVIELRTLAANGARTPIASVRTNADGRTDGRLIGAAEGRVGAFELAFHFGAYFRAQGAATAEPPFLDVAPIRFAIADAKTHYHVPPPATPWSYSTYRGG
jgi:5-hydroxyisourate hydrolase